MGTETQLHDAIAELAGFNDDPDAGGITREVYTPTYRAALERVAAWMRAADLEVRLDAVGNLFGRWQGSEPGAPRVLTGSHVDTTLNAGRYDGVLGVLGAIEAINLLREVDMAPRRSIELVAWAGEEPRFGTGCVGSRAAAGHLARADLDRLRDRDGTSMAAALREAGFDPDRLADATIDPAGDPRAGRAAHRAGRRARGRGRVDRRRHRDRRSARPAADAARRRDARGRDADAPAPRRARRRRRGDHAARAARARVQQRDDGRDGRRAARAAGRDQRRARRGRARRRRARLGPAPRARRSSTPCSPARARSPRGAGSSSR